MSLFSRISLTLANVISTNVFAYSWGRDCLQPTGTHWSSFNYYVNTLCLNLTTAVGHLQQFVNKCTQCTSDNCKFHIVGNILE